MMRTKVRHGGIIALRLLSPTGCQGTPFDIAALALFLASGEVDFINGAEILVDGGQVQATAM